MGFEVGEICLAYVEHPICGNTGWVDAVYQGPFEADSYTLPGDDCLVELPVRCPGRDDGFWEHRSAFLRKKHGPQQDNEVAEDWFIKDLMKQLKREEVKV